MAERRASNSSRLTRPPALRVLPVIASAAALFATTPVNAAGGWSLSNEQGKRELAYADDGELGVSITCDVPGALRLSSQLWGSRPSRRQLERAESGDHTIKQGTATLTSGGVVTHKSVELDINEEGGVWVADVVFRTSEPIARAFVRTGYLRLRSMSSAERYRLGARDRVLLARLIDHCP